MQASEENHNFTINREQKVQKTWQAVKDHISELTKKEKRTSFHFHKITILRTARDAGGLGTSGGD